MRRFLATWGFVLAALLAVGGAVSVLPACGGGQADEGISDSSESE